MLKQTFIFLLLIIATNLFSESFEIIGLENKEVVDFFGTAEHQAVLTRTEESTLLGKKYNQYLYYQENWYGPYHEILDVHISPTGEKIAIIHMKEGDQNIYVKFENREFVLDLEYLKNNTYSRYSKDKTIGFIGESFFIAPVKEKNGTVAYLNNEKLDSINPGIDQPYTPPISRIVFSPTRDFVVLQSQYEKESTVVYIYPDGKISSFNPKSMLRGVTIEYFDPRGRTKGTPADYMDCYIEAEIMHESILKTVNGIQFSSIESLERYYEQQKNGPIEFLFNQGESEVLVINMKGTDELGTFKLEAENSSLRVPNISNMIFDPSTSKVFIDFSSMEIKPYFIYGEDVIERKFSDFKPARPHEYRFTPNSRIPYLIYRDNDDNVCLYIEGEKITGPPISRGTDKWEYGWDVFVSDDGETIIWFIPDGRSHIVRIGSQEIENTDWCSMSDDGKSVAMLKDSQLMINGQPISSATKILQNEFSSSGTFSYIKDQAVYIYQNGNEYGPLGSERYHPEFITSDSGENIAWLDSKNSTVYIFLNNEKFDYFTKSKNDVRWIDFLEDESLAICVRSKSDNNFYLWRDGKKIGPFDSEDLLIRVFPDNKMIITELIDSKGENFVIKDENLYTVKKTSVRIGDDEYLGQIINGTLIYWDGLQVHVLK